jgi:hypothetical protein
MRSLLGGAAGVIEFRVRLLPIGHGRRRSHRRGCGRRFILIIRTFFDSVPHALVAGIQLLQFLVIQILVIRILFGSGGETSDFTAAAT